MSTIFNFSWFLDNNVYTKNKADKHPKDLQLVVFVIKVMGMSCHAASFLPHTASQYAISDMASVTVPSALGLFGVVRGDSVCWTWEELSGSASCHTLGGMVDKSSKVFWDLCQSLWRIGVLTVGLSFYNIFLGWVHPRVLGWYDLRDIFLYLCLLLMFSVESGF